MRLSAYLQLLHHIFVDGMAVLTQYTNAEGLRLFLFSLPFVHFCFDDKIKREPWMYLCETFHETNVDDSGWGDASYITHVSGKFLCIKNTIPQLQKYERVIHGTCMDNSHDHEVFGTELM